MSNQKILFVDDEINILEAYRRQLRRKFTIATAASGEEGLEAIRKQGPFAVVVSDLRMPGMDGIQFLSAVRQKTPESVCCLLTGQADLQAAIAAVNLNSLFRFLLKPCPSEEIEQTLKAAIAQYQLVCAEREILDHTLTESVQVLTEILSLVNPTAFGYASRIKRYVQHMAKQLKVSHSWEFEVAAMLSQIGCVTVPPDVLEKVQANQILSRAEQEMYAAHPKVASSLLAKIPRFESIAQMIDGLRQPVDLPTLIERLKQGDPIGLGTQMILVAIEFDRLITRGVAPKSALLRMKQRHDLYLPRLVSALETAHVDHVFTTQKVYLQTLKPGMILDDNIYAQTGTLLLARGHEITSSIITHLHNYSQTVGVVEPFDVIIPEESLPQPLAGKV
jgi:response regulator RpfG family c-di-GMP phosphodiesterase